MSAVASAPEVAYRSPVSRTLSWYRDAFGLWRRAPLRLVALTLACLLAEALLQLVPWAGVVVSKAVVPMLLAGIWIGLDGLHQRGEPLRLACLWDGWRQPRWPALWALAAFAGLAVFGVQLGCAVLVFGPAAIDAVLFGHLAQHPQLQTRSAEYVLLLPGLFPATLLSLALPLFLFHGCRPLAAVAGSVRRVLRHPLAFFLAMLPQLLLFALALSSAWFLPLLLVLQPLGTVVSFAAWSDPAIQHPASIP